MADAETMIQLTNVSKTFVMHLQGGSAIPVVRNVTLDVREGECVVLGGPSGAGKSSILKMIFGSYRCEQGPYPCSGRKRSTWMLPVHSRAGYWRCARRR